MTFWLYKIRLHVFTRIPIAFVKKFGWWRDLIAAIITVHNLGWEPIGCSDIEHQMRLDYWLDVKARLKTLEEERPK